MARAFGWIGVAALAAYPLLVLGGLPLRGHGVPIGLVLLLLAWPFVPAALGAAALLGGCDSKAPLWWLPGAAAVVGAALELIANPLVYVLLIGSG